MWVIKDLGFRGDSLFFSSKVGVSLVCVIGIWFKVICVYNWRKRLFLYMRWGIIFSIFLGKILCIERIGIILEMELWDYKLWRWRDE